jgi:hypothetical protein
MTEGAPFARSPRLAAWVVELFTSANQAQAILGDLAEEFSDMTSKSGVLSARRWYWRQSLRSIAHLAGSSIRTAPWSLAGVVLVGFLLRRFDFQFQLPERIVVAILRAQRPYSNLHYGFYVWQVTYGVPIACVVTSLLIGCVVAILAKGREVVASLALIVVSAVPFVLLLIFVYKHSADRDPAFAAAQFHFFVFRWTLDVLGIFVAGVLVRKLRSVSSRTLAVS